MDSVFKPLAAATGASIDQLKLLICIILCYPLGSIYVRIPRTWPVVKHLFSIIISFLILGPVMNVWFGALQLVGITLLTYFVSAAFRSPSMPWIVFVMVMGHLTIIHVHRALNETAYETFEISGVLMVLVMKLTTFAWNVHDGRRPIEELDKWQKIHRVSKFPSLLEFMGYAFYFPGLLVGPAVDYTTYISVIDGSIFASAQAGDKDRYVPRGRKRVAYTRMLTGFAFMGLYVSLGGNFTFYAVLRDSWLSKGLLARIVELQLIGVVERSKYYSVWLIAEGAVILTGLGFSGYTAAGGSLWDNAANVDILQIEIPSNLKTLLDAWNMKANVWLREAVYKRVARKGKKPGFKSTMFTFATSAFWHGFGAGYYLTFLYGGFASAVARHCRSRIRPYFVSTTNLNQATLTKRLYDILGSIATAMVVNFMVAPFFFSSLGDSIEAWRRVGWYGLWMIAPSFILFQILPPTPDKRKESKQVERPPSTPFPTEPHTVAPVHAISS